MLFVSRLDVRDHGGLVNFQELLQALTESAHDYVPLPVGTAVTKALHTRRMKAPIKLAGEVTRAPSSAHSHAPHSRRRRR